MARRASSDARVDLRTAFASFEETINDLLAERAQASVDEALAELGRQGPFRIDGAQVEVSIKNLTISTGATASGSSPRRLVASKSPVKRRARSAGAVGRPPGRVRNALLAAFATDEEMTTDEVRGALLRAGVVTTVDNVHQQLGRLVKSGDLARVGRGRYRRAVAQDDG